MSDPNASVNDRMAAIRARFVARAIEQRVRVAALRGQLAAKAILPEGIVELRQLCHSLHGAAGTFGFNEISEAADDAESKCDQAIAQFSAGENTDATLAELSPVLDRLYGLLVGLG